MNDMLIGVSALVEALGHARPAGSDPHMTIPLKKPIATNFGTFETKYEYAGTGRVNPGADLDPRAEMVKPVGTIVAALTTAEGVNRTVEIGHRDATKGLLAELSTVRYVSDPNGEYVIYVSDEKGVAALVLTREELPDLMTPGEVITFGGDDKKTIKGEVQKIVAFR